MNRTKLILAGLIAGTLAFTTACKSNKSAEREPVESEQLTPSTETIPDTTDTGSNNPNATPRGDTGGAGDVGTEPNLGTSPNTGDINQDDLGGSGMMNPENQGTGDTGGSSDAIPEAGTGGSGIGSEDLGGSQVPADDDQVILPEGRDRDDPFSPTRRP